MTCCQNLKTFHEFYVRIFENHESAKNVIQIKIKEEQEIDNLQFDEIEEPFCESIKEEPPKTTVNEKKDKKSVKPAKEKKLYAPKNASSDPQNYDDERIRETANMSCDLCSIKLDSFTDAKTHYKKSHKGIKGYLVCCGKKFIKRYRLLTHLNSHYNVSFPCKVCDKTFSSKQCLGRHMISHETLKLFVSFDVYCSTIKSRLNCKETFHFQQCDKCPKTFAKKVRTLTMLSSCPLSINFLIYHLVPSKKSLTKRPCI